jgi:hypothetical protein
LPYPQIKEESEEGWGKFGEAFETVRRACKFCSTGPRTHGFITLYSLEISVGILIVSFF